MQLWQQPLSAQPFTGQSIKERIKSRKGGRHMKKRTGKKGRTGKIVAVVAVIAAAASVIVYRIRH